MRETELWRRVRRQVGDAYAATWARDVALNSLDSLTMADALAAGVPCRTIWDAVWRTLELPESER